MGVIKKIKLAMKARKRRKQAEKVKKSIGMSGK